MMVFELPGGLFFTQFLLSIGGGSERLQPKTSKEAHAAVTYYTNNKKRMNYAYYRKEGYFIGSGTIESGAKRIGELRWKEAGARWTKNGAVHTAKARTAWLRNQWEPIVSRRSLPLAA